jgi:nitrite reductase/ring-hydroxylating ferredoxin subunit
MSGTDGWTRLTAADLPAGEMRAVEVGRTSFAVFHLADGSWHVTSNECTHEYALLTDGWLEGNEVECPLHAAKFDVRTGKAMCAPASVPVKVYSTRIEGDSVMVQIGN